MKVAQTIPLSAAILININVMLGSGIFANTVLMALLPGALGFAVYLLVGLLLFPLIFALARLIEQYPEGGFYTYAAETIHPVVGFISTWVYFIGKLASASLSIHVFNSLMYHMFPCLQIFPILVADSAILFLFSLLNTYNMRTGSVIQRTFLILKSLPILFAIIIGLYLFNGDYMTSAHWIFSGIPLGIPYVLFAFGGFETSCSISRSIENPRKNGPRALVISFLSVIAIVCLFQFALYGALGKMLALSADYRMTFPALLGVLFPHYTAARSFLMVLLHTAIGISALGASYGILFGNTWNLYTLAHHRHTFFPRLLTHFNAQGIPWVCVGVETIICLSYLWLTAGEQKALQQLSALGSAVAYTLSVIALYAAVQQKVMKTSSWLVYMALISCTVLLGACIRNFFIFGLGPLIGLLVVVSAGLMMYGIQHWQYRV